MSSTEKSVGEVLNFLLDLDLVKESQMSDSRTDLSLPERRIPLDLYLALVMS